MATYQTIRETKATMIRGGSFMVPAGTEVFRVKGWLDAVYYAVKSTELINRLTGTTDDSRFRYAWVDSSDVKEVTP